MYLKPGLRICSFFCFVILFVAVSSATKWNFFHVTDVHGWIFGHPHIPVLNADFGDWASLLEHMRHIFREKNEEFLVFDSGDLIEGTGLSDITNIHGEFIFPAVSMVRDYTALTMGNHDIGNNNVVEYMKKTFIPLWTGRYLTANSLMRATDETIGKPWHITTTELGHRLLVFGFLYNFTQEAPITYVVPVSISVGEEYFSEALQQEDIDMIIVVAHIDPTTPPELEQIYAAIRAQKPTTPIIMFSGHRHIEFFQWYDYNAFTIESGKYFEEIGYVQFDLEEGNYTDFSYEWFNTTREIFHSFSNRTSENFVTPRGQLIKDYIYDAFKALNLNQTLGCSPQLYIINAFSNASNSVYGLYINEIVPKMVYPSVNNPNKFFIMGVGGLRYDLYSGIVVLNDIYTVNPFSDVFMYIDIKGSQLQNLVDTVNGRTYVLATSRTRYVPLGEEAVDGSSYYYTNAPIESNLEYQLLVLKYDSVGILYELEKLYPDQTWNTQEFPTKYNSTDVITAFVEKYFPCTQECPCESF